MEISPDVFIFWEWHFLKINATIAITWFNIILLVLLSWVVTTHMKRKEGRTRGQSLMEVLVSGMEQQIKDAGLSPPRDFLPFLGTLFVFVLFSNILSVVPGYRAPTGSLSTTSALAICVFIAVPIWGVHRRGVKGFLRLYIKPSIFMLPFNILGEVSRTLALAVRLFGNMMSGAMIAGILLSVAPLFFPVVMQLLGLITGVIQAFIFAILAAVYIAAAVQVEQQRERENV